jgi:MFS family permease
VLPIGTALVTEFAPRRIRATMIVMGVVGVALGGGLAGLVAAQFMSIYGSRARVHGKFVNPRKRIGAGNLVRYPLFRK